LFDITTTVTSSSGKYIMFALAPGNPPLDRDTALSNSFELVITSVGLIPGVNFPE